jgi:hypothetical protein
MRFWGVFRREAIETGRAEMLELIEKRSDFSQNHAAEPSKRRGFERECSEMPC